VSRQLLFSTRSEAEAYCASIVGRPDVTVDGTIYEAVTQEGLMVWAVIIRTWRLD
jgi:hypothetical protein